MLGYIAKSGLSTLLLTWNYNYSASVINMVFVALAAVAGLMLFARAKLSRPVSGITGSMLILASTFEYLNSNATYLLLVSAVSFASVAALAYSRMSAVAEAEEEEPAPERISWPRIETF